MHKKEDLLDYDFQGWPVFRMNLREILLALGAREENGNITVFRARVPDDKTRKRLMKEWEEDELEIKALRAKKAKQDK